MSWKSMVAFWVAVSLLAVGSPAPVHSQDNAAQPPAAQPPAAQPQDAQKQIDAIKAAIPKFAVPMREVGDRFQNMYHAAKGENWALAAYMSKYMNNAMNPAKLTKPAEYAEWETFYARTFDPVNRAIQAQDFQKFEKAYKASVTNCNSCHAAMGYGFIKVVLEKSPPDNGIEYKMKSKAADVPK